MQRTITHYLISVGYVTKGIFEVYDFVAQLEAYPSRSQIVTYIENQIKDAKSISVFGISPQTAEQNARYLAEN